MVINCVVEFECCHICKNNKLRDINKHAQFQQHFLHETNKQASYFFWVTYIPVFNLLMYLHHQGWIGGGGLDAAAPK